MIVLRYIWWGVRVAVHVVVLQVLNLVAPSAAIPDWPYPQRPNSAGGGRRGSRDIPDYTALQRKKQRAQRHENTGN